MPFLCHPCSYTHTHIHINAQAKAHAMTRNECLLAFLYKPTSKTEAKETSNPPHGHSRPRAYQQTYTLHFYMHTHTCIQAHTHAHVHTHTYTYAHAHLYTHKIHTHRHHALEFCSRASASLRSVTTVGRSMSSTCWLPTSLLACIAACHAAPEEFRPTYTYNTCV